MMSSADAWPRAIPSTFDWPSVIAPSELSRAVASAPALPGK
jgi:hypothetical protein